MEEGFKLLSNSFSHYGWLHGTLLMFALKFYDDKNKVLCCKTDNYAHGLIIREHIECIVEKLINDCEDVNVSDNLKVTPLMYALEYNCPASIIEKLILKGADVNAYDKNGVTPLMYSLEFSSNEEIVFLLIKHGSDVNASSKNGLTPLMHLFQSFNKASMEKFFDLLLKHGADVNASCKKGLTPLMNLFKSCNGDSIEKCLDLLIKHGADVNASCKEGLAPLMHLFKSYNGDSMEKCLDLLIKHGADVNASCKEGITPLMHLFKSCNGDSVEKCLDLLLKHGAYVNVCNKQGMTPLMYSLRDINNEKLINLLLKHGAGINTADESGLTPLMYSLKNVHFVKYLPLLVEHGSDVNVSDKQGLTPLMYLFKLFSFERNNLGVERHLDLLIIHGADVNAFDKEGMTVLMYSLEYFINVKCVLLLIKHGVNINLHKEYILCHANSFPSKLMRTFVYKHSLPIDYKTSDGFKALQRAIEDSNISAVKALLLCGWNTDSIQKEEFFWNTDSIQKEEFFLLHYAREEEIVNCLIYFGVNPEPMCYNIHDFVSADVSKTLLKHFLLNFPNITKDEVPLRLLKHKDECKTELIKMKNFEVKAGLTFYDFCHLKKSIDDKFIDISPDDYLYDDKQIRQIFPLYCGIILTKLIFNRHERYVSGLRKMVCEGVIVKSVLCGGNFDCGCTLIHDVLYHICRYLRDYDVHVLLMTHPACTGSCD